MDQNHVISMFQNHLNRNPIAFLQQNAENYPDIPISIEYESILKIIDSMGSFYDICTHMFPLRTHNPL